MEKRNYRKIESMLRTQTMLLATLVLLALGAPIAAAQDAPPEPTPPAPVAAGPTAAAPAASTDTSALQPLEEPTYRPTKRFSYVARLIVRASVYKSPSAKRPRLRMQPWIADTGSGVELLILNRIVTSKGVGWLQVLLPVRPNGTTGWIRETGVSIVTNPMRITISLRKHSLLLYRSNRLVLRTGIVIGAPETPTPLGLFSIYQEVREPSSSELGPWALHLTAHSNVLMEYEGGEGRVAIHGMRGSLAVSVGTDQSHGCIRVPPRNVLRIAQMVRAGTPVTITRG